ncbi:MAG: hypothetical protein ACOYH4_04245 [Saccharofermentanales bacterium]|jgi:hypothetical protein
MVKGQENLIPLDERTKDERSEIQKKGGKASGRAWRKKANLKKTMEQILTLDLPASGIKAELEAQGIDPTMEPGLVLSIVMQLGGHVR